MTSLPVIIIGVNPFGLEAAHIFQKTMSLSTDS